MEQISGKIDNIYTKTVSTRFGDKEVYHAVVNGNDINLGFKCDYVEGETVTLNVEHKYGGYQLVQTGTKASGSTGGSPAPASNAPTGSKPSAPAFPINKNTKDISIIRQSSLNRAIEAVSVMMKEGYVIVSNEQEYLDKVLEVAYMFTDFGSGQREVKQAEAMAGYEAD